MAQLCSILGESDSINVDVKSDIPALHVDTQYVQPTHYQVALLLDKRYFELKNVALLLRLIIFLSLLLLLSVMTSVTAIFRNSYELFPFHQLLLTVNHCSLYIHIAAFWPE